VFAQPRCEHKLPRDRITSGEMPRAEGPPAPTPAAISVDDASYPSDDLRDGSPRSGEDGTSLRVTDVLARGALRARRGSRGRVEGERIARVISARSRRRIRR
jgi:hypothetical protein